MIYVVLTWNASFTRIYSEKQVDGKGLLRDPWSILFSFNEM